ncbi:hypothetical protein GW17_00013741 [Ensete ventricosum]|nr:hypothetical protein GW17_00013741 [Ensete ventricosum]
MALVAFVIAKVCMWRTFVNALGDEDDEVPVNTNLCVLQLAEEGIKRNMFWRNQVCSRTCDLQCYVGVAGKLKKSAIYHFSATSEKELSLEVGDYVVVRQVIGTRIARYRVVPPKIDHWRSIERKTDRKKKGRRRGKEEKKKRRRKNTSPARRRRPQVAHAPSSPAGHPLPRPLFLPREETEHLPARGERSRRRWSEGECRGKAGWFPSAYVEKRDDIPPNISLSLVAS